MKTSRSGQAWWIVGAVVIIAYALIPVLWILSLSLKPGDDITNRRFLPSNPGFDNYSIVFQSDLFTSALRNSIGIRSSRQLSPSCWRHSRPTR